MCIRDSDGVAGQVVEREVEGEALVAESQSAQARPARRVLGVHWHVHDITLVPDPGRPVAPAHLGHAPRLGDARLRPAQAREEHRALARRDEDPEVESGAHGSGGGQGVQPAHVGPERPVGVLRAAQPAQHLGRPQPGLRVHQQPVHRPGAPALGPREQFPGRAHRGERAGRGRAGSDLVDQDAQQQQPPAVLGVQERVRRPEGFPGGAESGEGGFVETVRPQGAVLRGVPGFLGGIT